MASLLAALQQHETALAALTEAQALALYRVVLEYKNAVVAQLGAYSRLRPQDVAEILLGLDGLLEALSARLLLNMSQTLRLTHALALQHHLEIAALQGAGLDLSPVRARVLAALADTTLVEQYSAGLYAKGTQEAIRNGLISAVLRGQTQEETAKTLSALTSVSKARGDLIVRMEMARAYSVAAETAAEESPGTWDKMIVEVIDSRNHPFSRAANGTKALPGERFKVSASDVRAAARAMGRRVGTVLWPESGGFYRGSHLPAHYNDRGRVIPWSRDWKGLP